MATDARSASLLTQTPATTPSLPFGYGPSSKRPANPPAGFLYYDTTQQVEIVYVLTTAGGAWRTLAPQTIPMVGIGTTRPNSPQPGYIFFDTTLQQSVTWSGSAWVGVTATAGMVGFGSTAARPTAPANGYLYFDTTLQHLMAWNGATWVDVGPGAGSPPPPTAIPVVTSAATAAATVGVAFTFYVTATGSPTSYGLSGTLPPGLTFNSSSGLISGTPTQTGSYPLTVLATNAGGTGTGALTITSSVSTAVQGNWTQIVGVAAVKPDIGMSTGFTLQTSTACTVSVLATANGEAFPPGVDYNMYDSSGSLLYSGNTKGGEMSISFSQDLTLAGGYTVTLTTWSNVFTGTVTLSLASGTQRFINASLRGLTSGPSMDPPFGLGLSLAIAGIDPTSTVNNAQFCEGNTYTLRQAPYYTWDLNGDTTSNPKSDFSAGLTAMTLLGFAASSLRTDSRIDVNG
jgi:hypothetical protein